MANIWPGGEDSGLAANRPKNQLNKNQKFALTGLAIFGALTVVLWFVQLKNSINKPLNSAFTTTAETGDSQLDSQTAKEAALKNKDSDADGLNDYDELYLYKTSPYLEDSDSDGVKDGQEISDNTDPNCPLGRTCFSGGELNSTNSAGPTEGDGAALEKLIDQYDSVNPGLKPAENNAAGISNSQLEILQNLDAASLRQMLLEAGMPKETLDLVTDEELLRSYRETLDNQTSP